MNVPISMRLRTVAAFVPTGSTVADVGSDHAYLPVYLVQNKKVRNAVAGEVHDGPYQSALRTVQEYQLQEHIFVRKGDGLEVIQPNEVNTIVIAGMGGGTILDILQADPQKLAGVQRLVLQPMNHVDRVRLSLSQQGFVLADEELVMEDGVLYEILAWERSDQSRPLEEWMCAVGPVLLNKHHPLLQKKAQIELERLNRAQAGISKSQTPDPDKLAYLQSMKQKWQEVFEQHGNGS